MSEIPNHERFVETARGILHTLDGVVLGQRTAAESLMAAYMAGGHALLEGVPGIGKTLLARSFAACLGLRFTRVQFTPDVMPTDLTGMNVFDSTTRAFRLSRGPVFTQLLMADEINRTPPKTQSALLEAMQEHRVTVQGKTYVLEEPFFVFATQNPIELEGTYPLPEAQLDRFMFDIVIDYLPADQEVEVVAATTAIQDLRFERTVTGPDIVAFQKLVRRVPVADEVIRYAVNLARTSRPSENGAPEFVKKWVEYGASVRAAQYLVLGGKARALMQGRYNVSFEDIRALAHPVFRHRILTNFHAESERVSKSRIVDELLAAVPRPRSGM
jgi:MoxR-like ATPase